ncbi:MAG: diaminopimelate epimerase [Elusimicrobiota bacterium]|jgi:diaminopimelate epimerase|nr:diaminopimelate epimerase [Elusimicrobiota bacterium]
MDINFCKISAAGNDFILIDNRKKHIAQNQYSAMAKKFCHRKYSIGADGLIFLEHSKPCDFKMKYLNADGSEAEMCGNGGRAIARFAQAMQIVKKNTMFFETDAGIVHADILENGRICLKMFNPKDLERNIKINIDGKNYVVDFINTGVPHVVLAVDNVENVDVKKLGQAIRNHKRFAPKGANVDFISKKKDYILVRTYERGVEDETLACGTGIMASAIIAVLKELVLTPVKIIARGGDELIVNFKQDPPHIHSLTLEGPADITFKGIVSF